MKIKKQRILVSFPSTCPMEIEQDQMMQKRLKEMMDFFEWRCAYSGELVYTSKMRSIDHIVPVSKGGENEIWNIVPMYKNYNKSKNAQDMITWYKQQDFYSEERLNKINEWQEYAYNKYGLNDEII